MRESYKEIALLLAVEAGWLASADEALKDIKSDKPWKSLPFTKVEPRQIIFGKFIGNIREGKYGPLVDIQVLADGDLDNPEKVKEMKPPQEATLGLSHAALRRQVEALAKDQPLKGRYFAIGNRGEVLMKKGKGKGKSFFDYGVRELAAPKA